MASGERDDNSVVVMMGVDPNGDPAPVKVDHVTGYVLMVVTLTTSTTPTYTAPKIDDNGVSSMVCVDSNGVPKAALVDNRSGLLWTEIT